MLEIRMKAITSRQNPTVRAFSELADAPDPAGTRVLLDGVHLVRDALAAGATFDAVAVDASRLTSQTEEAELARLLEHDGVEVLAASTAAIAAMSPVTSPRASSRSRAGRRSPPRSSSLGHRHFSLPRWTCRTRAISAR